MAAINPKKAIEIIGVLKSRPPKDTREVVSL
jgi:hypothetical protein